MSVFKRFVGDTVIYGITTVLSRLLGFLLTPIFTSRLKAAAEYGVFTNLYAYIALFNALIAFGMETTYFRFLQKVEPEDKEKVYNNSFFVTLCTAAVLLLSVAVFGPYLASWLAQGKAVEEYIIYVYLAAGVLVADGVAVIPFAKLRAEGHPIRYGVIKCLNIFVFIGSNLTFLYLFPYLVNHGFADYLNWFDPDAVLRHIFLSNLIASVVTLLLLTPQLRELRIQPDGVLIKRMLAYSFPLLVANISFIINEYLDKMMLPRLVSGESGIQDLGIYGAVSKIAVFLNLFVTAFRLGAEPFFFSYSKNKNAKTTYATIMEYFVIVMVVVMVGICANLDWLKYFIRTSDEVQQQLYWTGLNVVPLLLFNFVLLGIYMNLSIWYKLSDQTKYGIYISVIGAVATVVLNITLIPIYSYWGAAICTTIAYLLMVSFSYIWGQKNYRIPYPVQKIAVHLVIGVVLSGIIVGGLKSSFFWSNLLFVAYLAAVFLSEKKYILPLLRKRGR